MELLTNPSFWVGLCFFLFLGFLVYLKVPGMIADSLDKRAETIRQELEEARQLREEAQGLLAEYERKQRSAEKEAESIITLAKEEAEALAAETRENLKTTLERRMKLAEEKIARAEEQALNDVRTTAVNVAISAAEQIIGDKMTPAASKKLVDQSIKDLKGKLN